MLTLIRSLLSIDRSLNSSLYPGCFSSHDIAPFLEISYDTQMAPLDNRQIFVRLNGFDVNSGECNTRQKITASVTNLSTPGKDW